MEQIGLTFVVVVVVVVVTFTVTVTVTFTFTVTVVVVIVVAAAEFQNSERRNFYFIQVHFVINLHRHINYVPEVTPILYA